MKNSWQQKLQSPQVTLILFVAILLLGFALRVYRIGDKSVWWDEGYSVALARESITAMTEWTSYDAHPPLYYGLLHFWRELSGDSEFGLRLMSAVIGTLTIAATFLLGKTIAGRSVALLSAFFLAISRFAIGWSQELRMHMLATFFATLALWAAIRIWDKGQKRDWALYILFILGGLMSFYLYVSVLIVINLIWLLMVLPRAEKKWRAFWTWSLGQAIILILYAPWLFYTLPRIPQWASNTAVKLIDFLKIYWTVFTVGIPLSVEKYAVYSIPVLLVFLAGLGTLIWQYRRNWRQIRIIALLVVSLLFPAFIVFLVSLPQANLFYSRPIAPRYLIILIAAYATLLAWGIVTIAKGRRWPLSIVLVGVVIYAAWGGLESYHRGRVLGDDYISLARTITAYERENDTIVLHADTDWPIFAFHQPSHWWGVPQGWQITAEAAHDYLTPIWNEHEGVWLVLTPYAGVNDPNNEMMHWLDERATAVSEYSYGDKALRFYARTTARADLANILPENKAPRHPIAADLPNGTQLIGYDQFISDAHSGDTAHFFLYFTGEEPTETAVGFLDESGTVWQETAVTLDPTANTSRQHINMLISPDTPSNTYQFYVRDAQGEVVSLGNLNIRHKGPTALSLADVTIANELNMDFNGNIRLLGYELDKETAVPGEPVYLTIYWQAQAPVPERFKVFTHLIGDVYNINSDNFLWGQQDNEPLTNTRPTTTWRTGEVITDRYAIPLAADAPAGVYQVEIGLYDPATGVRLPLQSGPDFVILDSVTVK